MKEGRDETIYTQGNNTLTRQVRQKTGGKNTKTGSKGTEYTQGR